VAAFTAKVTPSAVAERVVGAILVYKEYVAPELLSMSLVSLNLGMLPVF